MMDLPCKELRRRARESLKGRYGKSLGVTFVGGVISLFGLFLTCGPMNYGVKNYYVSQQRGENPSAESAFDGFVLYGRTFLLWFLQSLFLFLWTLLLVIPAIVKLLAYDASPRVMRDYGTGAMRSIVKSRKLMWTFKAKLVRLRLSFTGWALLSCLLPVFGALFLKPYIEAAEAEFYAEMLECNNVRYYDDVKDAQMNETEMQKAA